MAPTIKDLIFLFPFNRQVSHILFSSQRRGRSCAPLYFYFFIGVLSNIGSVSLPFAVVIGVVHLFEGNFKLKERLKWAIVWVVLFFTLPLSVVECSSPNLPTTGLMAFSSDELMTITEHYQHIHLIGYESFPNVYKGWIDDGQTPSETKMPVAVKRLKLEGFPGHDEWLTKLNYLGQLHHPNLMKLIGYNLEDELHRYVVTEFLPKNNLDFHLYGGRATPPLSWETRMKIAVGVAEGLSFLHDAESQVIYRYLDPTNIFLDDDFNAKLSTYVSTQAMDIYNDARLGYTAPDSIEKKYGPGSFTTASDVYSYGVVLLVLLSGRPAFEKKMIGEIKIVRSASGMKSRRQLIQFMDHKLEDQYPQKTAFKVATLAIQCTLLPSFSRPNMSEVLRKLNKALRPPECRLQEH